MTKVIEKFAKDIKDGKTPKTSVFFLGRENFPKTFANEKTLLNYEPYDPQVIKTNLAEKKNILLMESMNMSKD